jgi:hypothetical protein
MTPFSLCIIMLSFVKREIDGTVFGERGWLCQVNAATA